ncbi:hypothetical protein M2480_002917 [Parabacteroides sp. PFB2-12]|uniref:DUF1896 family protein n=1 Tax=unclassified Parabacteroides TaxID=2649774 RepID=UPI0024770DB4|nr:MULTISPECIES: DUF1896 family protein [unclassified Parabacteroides]MDH6343752.1 hypothetical protein [Parabacteroides sp. PM6-13]MDH6391914.1 hypothetical protein [Parabacteroides sp. PFB2-12]
MENELNLLDFFQKRLFSYLNDYQPQMLKDDDVREFIVKRANLAHSAYLQSSSRGEPHYLAMEEANVVLYEGLEFSPVSFIQETYEEEKRGILDTDKALDIYYKAKGLFAQCSGNFEEVEDEVKLKERLVCFFA